MPTCPLPHRVLPGAATWPLHDTAATRALEARALTTCAPHALMQRAGLAVARLTLAVAPHAQRIRVAAGPGNNGGDGLVAALHLQRAGKAVTVHLIGGGTGRPADAADALQHARNGGVAIFENWPGSGDGDLWIDALLGIGARRAPQGPIGAAIESLNTARTPVLAIDLPSGLDPDTGAALGTAAVRATHTLSLLTLKPGLFTAEGRDACGDIWLDTLGVDGSDEPASAALSGAECLRQVLSPRPHSAHKGSFGDLLVVGGAPGMAGAALLAARAALAAGAGRVYLSPLDPGTPLLDAARPELMLRPAGWRPPPEWLRQATVVCGCGGGDAVRDALPLWLGQAARLVLDADALNAIAADPMLQTALGHRGARGGATVLTPHPLEAARLLGCSAAEVQADRLKAVRLLAARYRAVVVLKGSGTLVATPAGALTINPTGSALLASAGTGDVLAGWIGGLWSRPEVDGAAAALAAVWLHGRAADLAKGSDAAMLPLRAADLIDGMRRAAG